MTAFHLFSQLPTELRLQIWEATIEPRTVHMRCPYIGKRMQSLVWAAGRHLRVARFTSSTPVPAPLHVCFEARNHLETRYQKIHKNADLDMSRANLSSNHNEARHYIWLMPEIDIIDIGTGDLQRLEPIAHLVKRLQLHCNPEPLYFRLLEARVWHMYPFSNIKQVLIVNTGDMEDWRCHAKHRWPCGDENVFIVTKGDDEEDGEMVRLVDIIERGYYCSP